MADQVLLLRVELLRALGRAREFQSRSRALELELAGLRERFLVALLEAAESRVEARAERRLRQLHGVRVEACSQGLEAMCRALLVAIQRSRRSVLGAEAPSPIPPQAQGSA